MNFLHLIFLFTTLHIISNRILPSINFVEEKWTWSGCGLICYYTNFWNDYHQHYMQRKSYRQKWVRINPFSFIFPIIFFHYPPDCQQVTPPGLKASFKFGFQIKFAKNCSHLIKHDDNFSYCHRLINWDNPGFFFCSMKDFFGIQEKAFQYFSLFKNNSQAVGLRIGIGRYWFF